MGLEHEAMRAQVDRLLQSKTFAISETHRRLLPYLAMETLSGKADRIKEYTVGLEAFGEPATYDPRQDSIVRLQVGRNGSTVLSIHHNKIVGVLAVALVLAVAWASYSDVSLVRLRRQVAPAAERWTSVSRKDLGAVPRKQPAVAGVSGRSAVRSNSVARFLPRSQG